MTDYEETLESFKTDNYDKSKIIFDIRDRILNVKDFRDLERTYIFIDHVVNSPNGRSIEYNDRRKHIKALYDIEISIQKLRVDVQEFLLNSQD